MPLSKRLSLAFGLLRGYGAVADIGCDHGKLSAALAKESGVYRVVAADISEPSLAKARLLAERLHLENKLVCRLGDGLSVLRSGECEAAAVLGLGGEAMVRMLETAAPTAEKLNCLVLQPTSGVEEIRAFLYENGWSVLTDMLTAENGRIFQLFSVRHTGLRDPWPEQFPEGCFTVGYRCFTDKDPLLSVFCTGQINIRMRKIKEAEGTEGVQKLEKEVNDLRRILFACEKQAQNQETV